MRKTLYVFSAIVLCVVMVLLLSACENDMNDVFYGDVIADDQRSLKSALKNEYDLNDLAEFFKDGRINVGLGLSVNYNHLKFETVNAKYPVEIVRNGGYSVYKVSQGGYFYVFWEIPFAAPESGQLFAGATSESQEEPQVYFRSYLSSDVPFERFSSLVPGYSTAEDVKKIDPWFELTFLMSNGTYSYSYLNDNELLEIRYEIYQNVSEYRDLIVEKIRVVPRKSAPSRYAPILQGDLPK